METGSESLVVKVADLIGDGGADEGRRLNDLIRPALATEGEVELDFTGVSAVTEPFLEAAVAGLLDEIPFEDLLRRLIVSNMTVRDVQGLRYVLERARGDAEGCSLGGCG
ncbi:MAG TPA: STAS-like domain-containing protein [Methanoregulaceae archaeon]|nr:STAS-like domain-containing protein [Methanoregulaceae archaeon]